MAGFRPQRHRRILKPGNGLRRLDLAEDLSTERTPLDTLRHSAAVLASMPEAGWPAGPAPN